MSFFEELKRRNVVRVGLAYAILGWVLAQIAELIFDTFGAPDWVMQAFLAVLLLGLPIALFFAWVFEMTPEGIKRESEVDRSESITPVTGRKLDRTIIVLLVLAVIYFAIDKFLLAPGTSTPEPPAEITETEASSDHSIAVLPFVNMSDDASNEYFSDGLSEELLNVLAKNPALQVAARTSSFSLKGEQISAIEAGERLNVAHVLEGSVRKSGNRIRITAQLIRADNGYHLWSETWDRDLDDIFALQDEIAGRITSELLPHIVGGAGAPVDTYTPPVDAYQRYLLARNHFNRRTAGDIERAYEITQELVREYPEYPDAQALYAHATFLNSARTGGEMPWIVAESQARLALERALDIDQNLPEAWLVEGRLHARSYRPAEAIRFYERAIELNPSYADAYRYLAEARMDNGEPELAWSALETALRLDPISVPTLSEAIVMATEHDNQELADSSMRLLRDVDPEEADHVQINLHLRYDRIAEGAIAIEKFRRDWPDADPHSGELARMYANLGMTDEALKYDPEAKSLLAAERGDTQAALAAMEELAGQYTDPHDRADIYWLTYLACDMYDEALEVLSDLWYGYAGEEVGPRMDIGDTFSLITLLRNAGRDDEAAPIAEKYIAAAQSIPNFTAASSLLVRGEYDAAMAILIENAEQGQFPWFYSSGPDDFFLLEDHPDYPRFLSILQAFRQEQRELYDRLSAGS